MQKIRVVQLINAFIPCGAENVAKDLALRLDRDRFASIVIAVRRIEGYDDQERIFRATLAQKGVRSYCLGKRPGSLSLLPFLRLVRTLRREHPNILHMHGQLPQLLGLAATFFCGRPKTIITLHSSENWYDRPVFKYILKKFFIPFCKPDIVSISSTIDRKYDFPKANKLLIHNGIDISDLPVKRNGIRREGKKVIGVIGRLSEAKGHHILFGAVREMLKRRDDFVLHVAGDGELKDQLIALVQENHIDEHIHFLGFRNDIKALYQDFDMVVIPSLWEGLSITLLESMASGLPVVATAVSGNVDVIEHGKSGLLVPPHSSDDLSKAIEFVLDHPEKAASFGRSARKVVEDQFTAQSMVSQYESVYGHALQA